MCSEGDIRDQMEVNFYGPLRAVRACLPVMRERGSGHVILISSGAGYVHIYPVMSFCLGPDEDLQIPDL